MVSWDVAKVGGEVAYNFLSLFDTGLHLRNMSLRLIIDIILELGLAEYAKALLRVQLALSNMACSRGTC